MTKSHAIAIFGDRQQDLADALGLSKGRISQLPEILPTPIADRVRGAALRLGKPIPDEMERSDVAADAA